MASSLLDDGRSRLSLELNNLKELKMTMKELIKKVCVAEGKKKEVSIGNIRETLKVLAEILAKDNEALHAFLRYIGTKKRS